VENTLPPVQDKKGPSKKKTLGINDFALTGIIKLLLLSLNLHILWGQSCTSAFPRTINCSVIGIP
jgi:hypothetical protein